jgi:hypothetical protein
MRRYSEDTKVRRTKPVGKIHQGEPFFFIRAQDKLSVAAVIEYSHLLRHESVNSSLRGDKDLSDSLDKQADEVLAYAQRFKAWQQENPDKVKYPD